MSQGTFGHGWGDPNMTEPKRYGTRRFWLAPSTSGKVIFLDALPFLVREHQLKIGDSYQNWYPCLSNWPDAAGCPLCDTGDDPAMVAFLTVLSLFQKKDGVWSASKQLFPMKSQTYKSMEQYMQSPERRDLTGWVVKAMRADGRSASVGSTFDFERKIAANPGETVVQAIARECSDPQKGAVLGWLRTRQLRDGQKRQTPEEYLTPVDYVHEFRRPTLEELQRVARRVMLSSTFDKSGGSSGTPGTGGDAGPVGGDIPF